MGNAGRSRKWGCVQKKQGNSRTVRRAVEEWDGQAGGKSGIDRQTGSSSHPLPAALAGSSCHHNLLPQLAVTATPYLLPQLAVAVTPYLLP